MIHVGISGDVNTLGVHTLGCDITKCICQSMGGIWPFGGTATWVCHLWPGDKSVSQGLRVLKPSGVYSVLGYELWSLEDVGYHGLRSRCGGCMKHHERAVSVHHTSALCSWCDCVLWCKLCDCHFCVQGVRSLCCWVSPWLLRKLLKCMSACIWISSHLLSL